MKQYVFTILFTAAVTLSLSWAVWRLSLKYKLYPGIRERDVHKTPTPRLGGVAMFLGVVAAFAVSSQHPYFAIFWVESCTGLRDPRCDAPDRRRRSRR